MIVFCTPTASPAGDLRKHKAGPFPQIPEIENKEHIVSLGSLEAAVSLWKKKNSWKLLHSLCVMLQ